MGKWAQYQKRGRAPQQGTLLLPPSGWYSLTTILATSMQVTKLGSYPNGADSYQARAQRTDGLAAPTFSTVTNFGPAALSPLVSGKNYAVSVAWFYGNTQVSEWSLPISQTTP